TFNGCKNAAMPTTSVILKILLPITFPSDTSALPFSAAVILTVASGALVPNATIVKSTKIAGTRSSLAILDDPSTNRSAPFINKPNTMSNKIYAIDHCPFQNNLYYCIHSLLMVEHAQHISTMQYARFRYFTYRKDACKNYKRQP